MPKRNRKYFWCHACFKRRLLTEASDETLGEQKLCEDCYGKGWRLEWKVIAKRLYPLERSP